MTLLSQYKKKCGQMPVNGLPTTAAQNKQHYTNCILSSNSPTLVSNLFVRLIRLFWKFEFLFHEDIQYNIYMGTVLLRCI